MQNGGDQREWSGTFLGDSQEDEVESSDQC